jgi:protein-S-isoprenylcysteine O-methyltransferase Ste14
MNPHPTALTESQLKVIRALRRARIPLSGLLLVVFMFMAEPTRATILIGSLIAFVGVLVRAWASGCIRKDAELTRSGLYAYTRNPLYFGSFIIGLGFSVACGRLLVLLFFFVFFIAVYVPTMIAEGGHLRRLFGEAYMRYEQTVPLFFPRIRMGERGDAGFALARYVENREYQVLIGFAIALAVLLAKTF